MLGLLDAKGYQIVDDETQADVMVINTCCFIHDAKEESIQTILDMARYKEEGRLKALVVTGCQCAAASGDKETCDDRRSLCISEDCRRL